jgi:hypothetical protein
LCFNSMAPPEWGRALNVSLRTVSYPFTGTSQ